MRPLVRSVKYVNDYKLIIVFTNNETRQFNLKPYLHYPVYYALQDESFCRKLYVKEGVIQWSNDIDLDPDIVYQESMSI